MINRKTFFDSIRESIFKGSISQQQVEGIDTILNEWEAQGLTDLRWLAYMLATTFHETAKTMQPIAEYGKGKGRKYGNPDPVTGKIYYGRGFCQLTWKANYKTMGDLLGKPLVEEPELALKPEIATQILFKGMIRGLFTGKKLSDYFDTDTQDWEHARKIINGMDCALLIANYANEFYTALS
jgi:predicted chitinase